MSKKDNQKKFLTAYAKHFGNITKACAAARIDRGTYYAWKDDEEFQKELAATEPEEQFIDFAETALVQRIKAKDTTAIIFALKTKGKRRGYIERTETEVTLRETEVITPKIDDGSG